MDEYLKYKPAIVPDCGSAGGPQGYGCFGPPEYLPETPSHSVPEPSTGLLLAAGLLSLLAVRKINARFKE